MQSEIQIQAELFQTVWNLYPETRRCFFAIPNGGIRSKVEAAQFKASGLVAGEPDMVLLFNGKCYGFELKTDIGRLSPAQIECHSAWRSQGIEVYVIRSAAEGLQIISGIVDVKREVAA